MQKCFQQIIRKSGASPTTKIIVCLSRFVIVLYPLSTLILNIAYLHSVKSIFFCKNCTYVWTCMSHSVLYTKKKKNLMFSQKNMFVIKILSRHAKLFSLHKQYNCCGIDPARLHKVVQTYLQAETN